MNNVIVNSINKDDTYTATVLLFNNVQQMAIHKIGGGKLVEAFTSVDQEEYSTKYSNGKMWIKADSICDNHTYSFGKEA